jgi:cytidylate kinase
MTRSVARSIEALVEEQAHRWQLGRQARDGREAPPRPVVTVSRQHGAGGGEVARALAGELGFDLFDREIIQRIAESTHLSEQVVQALDEKDREVLTDWLAAFASRAYLSPVEYRYHLSRVVGALTRHGGAIILGRGAHLILGQGEALRVHVVAPLETRVRTVMEREGLSEREARRRIVSVEADRKAFLLKHFHADFGDPATYDLVVNTAALGVPGACRTIAGAVREMEGERGRRAEATVAR